MFNADKPSLDQLPTTTQLIRSTIIAGLSALTILLTVIRSAEYGIDPTGIGRGLGLTEMGEIKKQLAAEAEADRQLETSQGQQSNLWPNFLGLFISTAHAADAESWRDTATFTLKPGDTAEWKLTMERGQNAEYQMLVEGAGSILIYMVTGQANQSLMKKGEDPLDPKARSVLNSTGNMAGSGVTATRSMLLSR